MAAETEALKFKIDDQEYEVPSIGEFDLDEWQIVYDYSGLILDDFSPVSPVIAALSLEAERLGMEAAKLPAGSKEREDADAEAAEARAKIAEAEDELGEEEKAAEAARQRKIGQPAFTKAMLHIGYRRAHPDAKPEAIGKIVGRANFIRALVAINEAQADEEIPAPLASTTTPDASSPSSVVGSNRNGSDDSQTSSDGPAAEHAITGTAV